MDAATIARIDTYLVDFLELSPINSAEIRVIDASGLPTVTDCDIWNIVYVVVKGRIGIGFCTQVYLDKVKDMAKLVSKCDIIDTNTISSTSFVVGFSTRLDC